MFQQYLLPIQSFAIICSRWIHLVLTTQSVIQSDSLSIDIGTSPQPFPLPLLCVYCLLLKGDLEIDKSKSIRRSIICHITSSRVLFNAFAYRLISNRIALETDKETIFWIEIF